MMITLHGARNLLWTLSELVIEDYFRYTPSTALAAVALALFMIIAAVVAFQTFRSKFAYMHTVTIMALMEAAGYIALLVAIGQSGKSNIYGAYVSMQVFTVLAPNLLQGTDYWTVGHVLTASPDLTKGRWILGRKQITFMFAGADLLALIIQAIGISLWATARSQPDGNPNEISHGADIIVAGLGAQLVFFFCFTILAIWVYRHPKNAMSGTRELRLLYVGLCINIIFLFVRNIFRFAEFLQSTILGWPTPEDAFVLAEKQVLFYTLDTVPMLLCLTAFIVYHPGWYLPTRQNRQRVQAQQQQQFVAEADGKQEEVV